MRSLLEAQGQGCNAVQRSAPKCIAQRGQTAAAAILHPSPNVQIAGPIGGSLRGGRALVRLPVYGRGDHSNPSRDCACRSACATNTPRFRANNRTLPFLSSDALRDARELSSIADSRTLRLGACSNGG